ncbi:MAG: PhnD/SsuA/transferrin family substrate-binding protein [Desulfuromonas sp.]|nr:PhnD/SsuA/transferrin family substrate-binding protein [Desulfuromonas sp.]
MRVVFWVAFVIMLVGCEQGSTAKTAAPQFSVTAPVTEQIAIFAIHPLHNPERMFRVYGPLIDYLNHNISGVTIRLEASRNYAAFNKKLYARQPEFALPNPYQTVNALKHGYHVIAKMGDDNKFAGIILVRRDSNINQVSDLKGKKVSYPARTALAACMMPQFYLYTHGLDINQDIENVYVGSQESSIMNVVLGYVAAGSTWSMPWETFQEEHPDLAQKLELKWATDQLINNAVVARDDIAPELSQQVAQLLVNLHTSAEGRAILAPMPLSCFELANDQNYQVIADFLRTFSKNVRPLEEEENEAF